MTAAGPSGGDVQVVVFGLGEEMFALPVSMVREILDHRDASRIPDGPDWLIGLTDVRGQAVAMVDLRVRLGLAAAAVTPTTRILVVDIVLDERSLTLGLIVDRVLDVSSFAADVVEPTPEIGLRWRSDHIRGIVRRDGRFVMLLDPVRIFGTDDPMLIDLGQAA